MMSRRKIWILVMLMVGMVLVPSVLATRPAEISGWFAWAEEPYAYCFYSGEFLQPDGIIQGCVIQPESPGRAAHGTFYDLPYPFEPPFEPAGECQYSLATFSIPGRPDNDGTARFSIHRCSGSLEGLHMIGTGLPYQFDWEGSYHYEP
jgi:hypothetical protein